MNEIITTVLKITFEVETDNGERRAFIFEADQSLKNEAWIEISKDSLKGNRITVSAPYKNAVLYLL